MTDYSIFPIINAVLNGTSAVFIGTGVYLIKKRQIAAHRFCMISAVVASTLFLTSYLYYHAHVGSVHFPGQGWPKWVYYTILTTHTILAATVVPFVIVTLSRALRGRFDLHRRSARWTYPIWMYVSVTGVVIYVMLYQIYGAHA